MEDILKAILAELIAIRAALETRPAPAPTGTHLHAPATDRQPSRFDDEPVPQPAMTWSISDAEAHEVHFGKNAGVKLADLKDRSLAFYAKEKPPSLKRDGTPFAKRKEDEQLENAARTVWHHRRGTLGNATESKAEKAPAEPTRAEPPAPAKQALLDEDVPF